MLMLWPLTMHCIVIVSAMDGTARSAYSPSLAQRNTDAPEIKFNSYLKRGPITYKAS